MKNLKYLLIVLLAITFSNSNAQWYWLNPLPGNNPIRSIMFADSLTGWVVGDCGSISKTLNSGTFWQNQYSGTTKQLLSICVIDTQNVYIGGQNGIIVKTTNGGTNWKLLITDSTANIRTISFINNNTGWCGGTSGIGDIFRTTNGGNNWLRQTIGSNITINSICFTDNNTGWAGCSNSKLYKTTNGGQNWDTISYQTQSYAIHTIKFINANYGYFTTAYRVFRTTDGGNSWSYFEHGGTATYNHTYLYFADQNNGWIVYSYYAPPYNNGYSLLTTNDGGISYQTKSYPTSDAPSGLCLLNSNTGFVVTNTASIYKSTNFGTSYNKYYSGMTEPMIAICSFSNNIVYATSKSAIYKSTNGGFNWGIIRNSSNDINNSHFLNASTGFVISGPYTTNNYVSYTTNGGNSWTNKLTGLSYVLNFYFLNTNTGWLIGTPGRVFKTTNGGSNYNIYLTGNTGEHKAIFFIDENTGWTSGVAIRDIFRTTTGGITWTKQFTETSYNSTYNSIYFLNRDTGWMAGNYVIKTTNSGINWIIQDINNTSYLTSIKFINPETGWTVGDGGQIYFSTNGGNNWTQQTPVTFNNLQSVSFVNQYTGYIAGDFGTILKTTNGGYVWVKESNSEIPKTHSLRQNYPNPFNSTTKISFALPKTGLVTIKVFDVLGKEIETLVNESLKPGTYETAFDGSSYPSGVYFYRLVFRHGGSSTDGFTETKRMVLIK